MGLPNMNNRGELVRRIRIQFSLNLAKDAGKYVQQPQVVSPRQVEVNMLKSHKMPIVLRMTAGPALSHIAPRTSLALCAIDGEEHTADDRYLTLEEQIAAVHSQPEEPMRKRRWNEQQQNAPSASRPRQRSPDRYTLSLIHI